jgi:FkbM family methyltransferase
MNIFNRFRKKNVNTHIDDFSEYVEGNIYDEVIQSIIAQSFSRIKSMSESDNVRFFVNEKNLIIEIFGHLFKINNEEELYIINEIFIEKIYNFKANDDLIILDIGSNIGASIIYFNSFNNVKKIFAYEPVNETFECLKYNLELNNLGESDHIIIENVGLSSSNKIVEFQFSSDYKGSVGILPLAEFKALNKKTISVNLVDCTDVFEKALSQAQNLNCSIMVKMDCEGGEYEILERLKNANLITQIKYIVMEWHGNDINQIVQYLDDFNFFSHKNSIETGMLYGIRK